jgi:hypothetical protein
MIERRRRIMMTTEQPVYLLYLLTVGRDKELVLRVHSAPPTLEELTAWMHDGTVRPLTVSRFGDEDTSILLINFGHVIGSRLAPYSETRTGSF